jgi:flagellar biosynthetic protein FliQ
MLGLGLLVGILVSIFQAITQIQEQTLSFVPKIVAVFVAVLLFGPWMLSLMVDYTREVFLQLPQMIR